MTVTVHVVDAGRSNVGSIVIVEVPESVTAKVSGVPVGQSSENELVVAFTGSLKVTVMLLFAATLVAPFAGVVPLVATAGAWSFGVTKTGNSVAVHCDGEVT